MILRIHVGNGHAIYRRMKCLYEGKRTSKSEGKFLESKTFPSESLQHKTWKESNPRQQKKTFLRHFQPVEHVPPVEVGRVEVGPVVEEQVGRGWPGIRGSVGDHAKKIWIGETNRKDSSLAAAQPDSTNLFLKWKVFLLIYWQWTTKDQKLDWKKNIWGCQLSITGATDLAVS